MATTRRTRRWWLEAWVTAYKAELKSPAALKAFMDHKGWSANRLAEAVRIERVRQFGKDKTCSRQMICKLLAGKPNTCSPDLAAIIETVLDLPPHALFALVPKSSQQQQGRAA